VLQLHNQQTATLIRNKRITLTISAIIPTIGRPTVLKTVNSLLACEGSESLDIIVVGTIKDDTVRIALAALASQAPQIRHFSIHFDQGDSSRKKNFGAKKATGEILAFLDDDSTVDSNWKSELENAFKSPDTGLVSGAALLPADVNQRGQWVALAQASFAAGHASRRYNQSTKNDLHPISWHRVIGCNAAWRKTIFECIGGFSEAFYPGEDLLAAWQTQALGHSILFSSRLRVRHYPRQTINGFCKQIWTYGATRVRLGREGVESDLFAIIPPLWILTLLLSLLGAPRNAYAAWFALGQLGIYGLCVSAATFTCLRQTRTIRNIATFFFIVIMHLSYGLGEWYEILKPNRDFGERHS
jgi:glycosyltransferase involved in cell wall biosynthesis